MIPVVDFEDRIRDAYEDASDVCKDAAGTVYDIYTDDRIRQLEEASVLSNLSPTERYETVARHDAGVLRAFEEERQNAYTTDTLDTMYDEAREELELTDEGPLIELPSREDLEQNAPRSGVKFVLRRALKVPASAGVALDLEYEVGNPLRRARSMEENGEELEAELMRAAVADRFAVLDSIPFADRIPFADQVPFQDPELSTDRLDTLYAERRQEIEARDGFPLLDKIRDAFHH